MSEAAAPPAASGLRNTDFFAAIRRNQRRTTILCLGLILIGGIVGYVVGLAFEVFSSNQPDLTLAQGLSLLSPTGLGAAIFMLLGGSAWTLIALFFGDKIVLGLAGAKEVTAQEEPRLHNVVEEMAIAAGLPKPRVYVIDTEAMNAFATGLRPDKSAIGVTRGLLDALNRDELQGVIGHEMSHVANDDIIYMTAVGVIVGLIVLISDLGLRSLRVMRFGGGNRGKGGGAAAVIMLVILIVVLILAPIGAVLLQMAISRQREYLADASSVKLTRNPLGLIGALQKIDGASVRYTEAPSSIRHLFIADPKRKLKAGGGSTASLFATHPPVADRIARLRNLGEG